MSNMPIFENPCGAYSRYEMTKHIPLCRLEEICQAERDGRCVVLPCKVGDAVWDVITRYKFEITQIELRQNGSVWFRCGNKGTEDYMAFDIDDIGERVAFSEPPNRTARKEAALKEAHEHDT